MRLPTDHGGGNSHQMQKLMYIGYVKKIDGQNINRKITVRLMHTPMIAKYYSPIRALRVKTIKDFID